MTRTLTQGERLTKIETLLETRLDEIVRRFDDMGEHLKKIEGHQAKQDEAAQKDRADLAKLKDRGTGILIGVGLAGGAIGAGIAELFGGLFK